jgi:hypothetical protein
VTLPSNPLAFIDGISGFVLNNQMGPNKIDAVYSNDAYQFTFTPNITYLNYQFLMVNNDNPCFFCQNSPYIFNGSCLASCPQG